MPLENTEQTTSNVTPNVAEKISEQNNENPFMDSEPSIEDAIRAMDNATEEDEYPAKDQTLPAVEPQKEEAKPEDQLSQKFAELAKMEAKYQADIREMKQKLEEANKGIEGKYSKEELLSQLQDEYKKNPRAFLEEKLGGSYDSLSDFILNEEDRVKENQTMSVVEELKKEIQGLKEERNQEKETQKTEAVKKQEEEFKGNIKNYISSKEDDFGLIGSLDESGTVFDVMMEHYDKTGKTMDIDDACRQVEDYYVESIKKIAHLPKVKKLFSLDNNNETKNTSEKEETQSSTLTNNLNSSHSDAELESMSDEDRMALAMQML